MIPDGNFPELISFRPQKDYIRQVLRDTVTLTADKEDYTTINALSDKSKFFFIQGVLNKDVNEVPSHEVIREYIEDVGRDYRYEDSANPVKELIDRRRDNVSLGRVKEKVPV